MTRANGAVVVFKKLHRRVQQFGGLDSHKIAIFLFEKLNPRMCQWLQRCPKTVFHLARAIGDAAELSMIAAEKSNDPISLSERICLQYNRVALMESHIEFRAG